MKRLTVIVILMLAFCSWAHADIRLTSNPQCKFDGTNNCAAGYEVSTDAGKTWIAAGAQDVGTDQIRLWHSLEGIANGNHKYQIRAVNVWGESAPVPFDFRAGPPSKPGGIQLVDAP